VSASENKEGAALSVEAIKQITGKDSVTVRFLHQEFFEFQPAMKIWLATNHRPKITDSNRAIWDRLHLIPFTVSISEEEEDRTVAERLKAEHAGILNWMIKGCQEWMRDGLNPPAVVMDAVKEYRATEDVVRMFLDERYVEDPQATVAAGVMYQDYEDWSRRNGLGALSLVRFGRRLTEDIGLEKSQHNRTRVYQYHGYKKRPEIELEDATSGIQTSMSNVRRFPNY